MKKILCSCWIILCFFLCTACDVSELSTLKDISRPYVGEYQCKTLMFGDEEMIDRFEYVKLTLDGKDAFIFRARDEFGHDYTYEGTYQYHDDRFTFTGGFGIRKMSRDIRYDQGTLSIDLPFAGKLLHAEFAL